MRKSHFVFAAILLYLILLPTISFSSVNQSINLIKIINLVNVNYVVSAKTYPSDPTHLFLTARGKMQKGNGGGIFVFDISKPENPELVSQWRPSMLKGFTVADNVMEGQDMVDNIFVSVSIDTGKMYVFTLSSSSKLKLKSWIKLQHTGFINKFRALHVKIYQETNKLYALITSPQSESLIVVDITNLDHPKEVASTALGFSPPLYRGAESVYIHGKYAYCGAFNGYSLNIINLSGLHSKNNPTLAIDKVIYKPYYDQMVSIKDPRVEHPNILYSSS